MREQDEFKEDFISDWTIESFLHEHYDVRVAPTKAMFMLVGYDQHDDYHRAAWFGVDELREFLGCG